MLSHCEGTMFKSELMLTICQLQTKTWKYTENETHVDGQLAVGVQAFVRLEIETNCCEAGVPTCENDFHQWQQGGFYVTDLYVYTLEHSL
jgi:hypothetical protein